ncbi:MAG: hypothetical protein U0269_35975 [Polyangiales bacterium]
MLRTKGMLLLLATAASTVACSLSPVVGGGGDAGDASSQDVAFDVVRDSGFDARPDAADASVDTGVGCPSGQLMCGDRCVDPQSDRSNCGACGTTCPGTQVCVSGACQLDCTAPQVRCGMGAMMTCVDTQTDTANCGGCGTNCAPAGATGACSMGVCTVGMCNSGLGDCDSNSMNGCETDTQTSLSHCGGCGMGCAPANATGACAAGACGIASCTMGFADCDMRATNGCEVNTQTDVNNCGACGTVCPMGQFCVAGACRVDCTAPRTICGAGAMMTCVDLQSDTSNCGTCGTACSIANATAACAMGACGIASCNAGFGNCDGNAMNGCETNTNTSLSHCGGCGMGCAPANATGACTAGACGIASCNAGFANCDGNPANGCEVDTNTSLSHCGGCGMVCAPANATGVCTAGGCGIASCNAGFADCDGNPANGCEVDTRTNAANCGMCGTVCSTPNGTASCAMGVCGVASCNMGFADCDMSAANGCEVNTQSSAANCGACGNVCSVANGTPACTAGMCAVASCSMGFADCNGSVADGCEVNTSNSASNCGACGNVCTVANGTPACAAGMCAVASCSANFANCNGSAVDGCEINTSNNVSNCGACGNVCTIANGTPACTSGLCAVASCGAGFANCDGNANNGCETNTNTSSTSCGACGTVCPAGQSCSMGTCVFGSGATGPLNVTGTVTVNANAASVNASAGSSMGTISNVVGMIAAGRQVLLHQTQGAAGSVGQYEYARVQSVVGSMVAFDRALANSYTTGGSSRAQIVVVEEYTALTMAAGSTLTAPAWNGTTGGLLALDIQGAVTIPATATITMNGRGFRGASHGCFYRCQTGVQGESSQGAGSATTASNGAGGGGGSLGQDGSCGGGGGYGAGGATGAAGSGAGGCGPGTTSQPGGVGGAGAGSADLRTAFFFGGAGGEGGGDEDGAFPGAGGNGGGAIFLRASSVASFAGTITANGNTGANGDQGSCGGVGCGMGGGGGGAGGTIRLVFGSAVNIGASLVTATGGGVGLPTCGLAGATGGAGAVGRIAIVSPSTTGASVPVFDPR